VLLADGGGRSRSSKLSTLLPRTRREECLRYLEVAYRYLKVRAHQPPISCVLCPPQRYLTLIVLRHFGSICAACILHCCSQSIKARIGYTNWPLSLPGVLCRESRSCTLM